MGVLKTTSAQAETQTNKFESLRVEPVFFFLNLLWNVQSTKK